MKTCFMTSINFPPVSMFIFTLIEPSEFSSLFRPTVWSLVMRHSLPVWLLPADGRSDQVSLRCDLALKLEGQTTSHFHFAQNKNTPTHAHFLRHSLPRRGQYTGRIRQQPHKWRWRKSAVSCSKGGKPSDKHEVNFALNSFSPHSLLSWFIFLSVRLYLSVGPLWYQCCVCVTDAKTQLFFFWRDFVSQTLLFISTFFCICVKTFLIFTLSSVEGQMLLLSWGKKTSWKLCNVLYFSISTEIRTAFLKFWKVEKFNFVMISITLPV